MRDPLPQTPGPLPQHPAADSSTDEVARVAALLQAKPRRADSIEDLCATPLQDGRFTVDVDGLSLDGLLVRDNAPRLFVFLAGARRTEHDPLPLFQRWRWKSIVSGSALYVADPTLALAPDRLSIGWYFGTAKHNAIPAIARLVDSLARELGVRRQQVLLYGSSAGGFASFAIASHLPGASAVAINPQTSILDYYPRPVRDFLDVVGLDAKPAGLDEYRHRLELRRYVEADNDSRYSIVQNVQDRFHYERHYQPFCEHFGLPHEGGAAQSRPIRSFLYDSARGHGAEPLELAIQLLTQTLPDMVEERTPTASATKTVSPPETARSNGLARLTARILPCNLVPTGERDLQLAADDIERRSHNLIVTRYFLRIFSPNSSERMTDAEARTWFAERERVFNRYTLPSVVAQTKKNKTWLVFVEKSLAKLLPKTLTGANRPPFVEIVEVDSSGEDFFSFRNDIGNRINTRLGEMQVAGVDRPVITVSRLDNDDALSHDYLTTLSRLSLSESALAAPERIITFPHGVQYLEKVALGTYLFNNNHFLNSCHSARFEPNALHAMSFNHSHLFAKASDVQVVNTDLPMWVEVVHGKNVSNKYQSRLPLHRTGELDARFGSDYPTEGVAADGPAAAATVATPGPASLAKRLVSYVTSARDNAALSSTEPRSPRTAEARPVDYDRMLEVQKMSKAMKPNDFLRAYSRILVAEDVKTMFEIGVHQGGSLKFWRELYGPGLKLYGLDIKEECAAFAPTPADKVFIGSQTDVELLESIEQAHGPFDLIIDDGSHQNPHMWTTFNHLFKALRPGGIYIVEDMFTSYWERYGGGLRRPESFVERCKGYVDTIYARFMSPNYAKHHKIRPGDAPVSGPVTEAIESIAFHRCGIVVIRKRADMKSA